MRHHERVVKAAHEHRTPTCHHVREHAEELFLQVVLVNTIMILESRLCAPADVKRGIDVCLRFNLHRHQGSKPESAAVGCPVSQCAPPPSRRCFRRQSVRYFDRYRGSSSFFTVRQRKAVMDNAPMTAFGNLFEQLSEQTNDGLAHHHNHTDIHAAHRPFV